MHVEFYPKLLRLKTLPVFITALFVLANVNHYSFAQEQSSFTLKVDGVTYDIPYSAAKGKVVNATAQWEKRTLTFDFDPPANGMVVMELPRNVVDDMANINLLLIYNDKKKNVAYEEKSDCDTRTVTVNFEDDVSRMTIIGSFLGSPNEPKKEATLRLDVDGKMFELATISDSRICDWRFVKGEKKLELTVQNGTRLQLVTPNELVGRPYTILVDGNSVDYSMYNVSDSHSSIGMKYDNANTINIIGTTAIPEFPIGIIVAALAMLATIILLQLRRTKLRYVYGD